jgi:hypothetical protein
MPSTPANAEASGLLATCSEVQVHQYQQVPLARRSFDGEALLVMQFACARLFGRWSSYFLFIGYRTHTPFRSCTFHSGLMAHKHVAPPGARMTNSPLSPCWRRHRGQTTYIQSMCNQKSSSTKRKCWPRLRPSVVGLSAFDVWLSPPGKIPLWVKPLTYPVIPRCDRGVVGRSPPAPLSGSERRQVLTNEGPFSLRCLYGRESSTTLTIPPLPRIIHPSVSDCGSLVGLRAVLSPLIPSQASTRAQIGVFRDEAQTCRVFSRK